MVKTASTSREIARAPRAVLDTNIVLSALVFTHGRAVALRDAWQAGRCEPHVSKATAGELIRVLGYPEFKLTNSSANCWRIAYPPASGSSSRCKMNDVILLWSPSIEAAAAGS